MRKQFIAPLLLVLGIFAQTSAIQAEPNHLEPIWPYDSNGYHQLVHDLLIPKNPPVLWMITFPSFRVEYSVMLRKESDQESAPAAVSATSQYKWTLEVARAIQPIWHWKKNPSGDKNSEILDLRRDVKIDRREVQIDPVLAGQIQNLWTQVLKQTRYDQSPGNEIGVDGETYQFHVFPKYYGETWSPKEDSLPGRFVNLAEHLKRIVEAKPDERKTLLRECDSMVKTLSAEVVSKKEKAS